MGKGQELYKKAKQIMPGGTQLLSKRPEMFLPDFWPAYYSKAKGCEVWDLDGNKYIDMSFMGIGACVIGYADDDVDAAVKDAIDRGNATTLNAPEEVELASKLCELHPWANMVRYARSGGEAMAIAVRIARAKTGKDKILFCGYHGWHDWYLASNLADDKALDGHLLSGLKPKGVPRALKGTAFPFAYNDTKAFLQLLEEHGDEVGVVTLEPIRNIYPEDGFLETVREETKKRGIVLIADEVSSGFRLNAGGAHLILGFEPDIAVFSKALGNGFPIAAVIGRGEIMSAAEESFISSTNWTENIGPTAALAMIKKYVANNVGEYLSKIGKEVQDGWAAKAKKHGIKVHVSGIYPLGHFEFEYDNPLILKTLYTQFMLQKGFLATTAYYASFGHKETDIQAYVDAIDEVFEKIAPIIKEGQPEKYLEGPVSHAGFKRLT